MAAEDPADGAGHEGPGAMIGDGPATGPLRAAATPADPAEPRLELADSDDADALDAPIGPRHGRDPFGGRHRLLGAPGDGDDQRSRSGGTGRFLRDLVVVAVLALVISVALKTFLIRPYYIPSASMHDTLVEDDRVLVNLLVPELVPLNRGDVVVFTDPGGWLPAQAKPQKSPARAVVDGVLETVGLKPEDTDNTLIKRVIGLPGDHVVCCNSYGQLSINDVAISEPYVALQGNGAVSGIDFDVTVPADAIWVMGDNRYNSQDSRYHQDLPTGGFVPMSSVVGRAIVINLPLDRISILGDYPEVFANVPNREPGRQP